jgi:hypothetical protein
MAAIGILRYGLKLQRREVQILCSGRNINISEGEVSELSKEFLLRFYLLHKSLSPRVREIIESNQGKVFHVDGTQDDGSEVVFTFLEGLTGIVLDSFLLRNEGKNELIPVLQEVKNQYGSPDVLIRDLSTQIRDATSSVFPGVPQQACHVHFINDLGETLFEKRYVELRKAVLDTGVLARLIECRKRVSCTFDGGQLEHSVRLWTRLVVDYVEEPRIGTSHFPLELPYFECIRRALDSQRLIHRLIHALSRHMMSLRDLRDLGILLDELLCDESVVASYPVIKQIDQWFERIRDALRQSRKHMSAEDPKPRIPTDQIKAEFIAELQRIRNEAAWIGGPYTGISVSMTHYCEQHMDELFVKVLAKDGTELPFRRENNLEESMHRRSRMGIRRRTGRGNTNREMVLYGPLLAVFQNLMNPIYINRVFKDIQSLPLALKGIPVEAVEQLKHRLLMGRKERTLPVKDAVRLTYLEEFVGMVEAHGLYQGSLLDEWSKKVEGEAITEF